MQYLFDIADSRPPDFVIGDPARPYLKRWWVIPRNDNFNVYLHHILRNDDDRANHDHPWANTSIILRGSLQEVMPDGTMKFWRAGDVVHRQATDRHRLMVEPFACWTLFLTGPWERSWGFWCEGERFVPWQEFCKTDNVGEVGKGCG